MNSEVQTVAEGREVGRCQPPGEEVARCEPGPVEGDPIQQQNTRGQALSLQVTVHLLALVDICQYMWNFMCFVLAHHAFTCFYCFWGPNSMDLTVF